jgi:hypothetical protein
MTMWDGARPSSRAQLDQFLISVKPFNAQVRHILPRNPRQILPASHAP